MIGLLGVLLFVGCLHAKPDTTGRAMGLTIGAIFLMVYWMEYLGRVFG